MTLLSTQHLLIRSITPSGGPAFDVGTINVLVGGNNSGKSEALSDLARLAGNYALSGEERMAGEEPKTRVLQDVTFVPKLSVERLLRGVVKSPVTKGDGNVVQGLGPDLQSPYLRTIGPELKSVLFRPVITARSVWSTSLGEIMPLRVAYIPVDRRMKWLESSVSTTPLRAPENLLQALRYAPESVHEQLDQAISLLFDGLHVRLDATEVVNLSLRVAKKLPELTGNAVDDVQSHQALRRVDEEGDGLKSCVAIVLAFLLSEGRAILLDQPEAHLQPEQARRLGNWIAENAAKLGTQVFATTGSPSFLEGLFGAQADVSIVRVSRRDDRSRFELVPPEIGRTLATYPTLAAQNALDCFFHDAVVVLPVDADRVLHRTVAVRILRVHNVAFVHSHGVRNLANVARVLRRAHLPTCVVAELDVLQHEEAFVELVKALSQNAPPQPWLATRDRLAGHVEGWYDARELKSTTHEVEAILDQLKHGGTTAEAAIATPGANGASQKWDRLCRERLAVLPPELRVWVEELLEEFKRIGLFVWAKGRLQGWANMGPVVQDTDSLMDRAVESLDKGECPAELRAFVAEVAEFAKASTGSPRPARASHSA